MLFKTTLYGVKLKVDFSEEEKQIIKERNLAPLVVMEREWSADVDAEKMEERGLGSKMLTAATKGKDANSPDLTVSKLLHGADVYYLPTLGHAKEYADALRQALPELKTAIEANTDIDDEPDSFEL